jgi:acyl carrier protein
MKQISLQQHLREILKGVRPQAPHDKLGVDDDIIETLGLDSLDIANFIVELDYLFHIQIDFKTFKSLKGLRSLEEFILSNSVLATPIEQV